MRCFPFPDKKLSREELTRDILYDNIPSEDRVRISDRAWETGVAAARCLIERYATAENMMDIAFKSGLKVARPEIDNVVGKVRYFSEYFSNDNRIVLYMGSLRKWANENGLLVEDAEELVLSHEYYHFLECNEIGETSAQYVVPTLKIGNFVIMKAGIRALSEIGAHGFSRTYYESVHNLASYKDDCPFLQNEAVNVNGLGMLMREGKFFNL
jgi:hypothetical protein